jgi:N-acetylmuramoyl-L-alanine amidase CwlA
MKPCAKLNNGTGKPRGVCVHNTGMISVASGTNAAEQYTRATYNGNMSGVVVHFYVWDTEIWQNLREDERGWHAADGSIRRSSQRKDGSTIGGNLDTIAIECIGDRKLSEDTTAKLVAWLCKKHGLDPKTDVYTHKYFYPRKQCPQYILPHWNTFLSNVQKYYNALTGKAIAPKAETAGRTHTVKHGDTLWKIAKQYLGKGSRYTEIVKLNSLKSNVLYTGQVLALPEK